MDDRTTDEEDTAATRPVQKPSWSGVGASWRTALRSAREHVRRNRVSVAAGSFAYRWFLAIFPSIIALLGVATAVHIPHSTTVKLIDGVTKALPAGAADVFTTAITHAEARGSGTGIVATVVAAVIGLWAAVSGMVMLEEGLDIAYEIRTDRSAVAKRVVALPLLAATVVLGGSASALTVFGVPIGTAIGHAVPFGGAAVRAGWVVLRWLVALGLIAFLLSVVYYVAPNRTQRWQWMSPGALVATALWAVISVGFSFYVSASGSYSRTYGAFAGVAILIFWLYLTGIAIFVGGEINAAFERQDHPAPY